MSRTKEPIYISYMDFNEFCQAAGQGRAEHERKYPFPDGLGPEGKERFLDCIRQVADATLPGLRDILGISRKRMAEIFSMPMTTLKSWENGYRNPPEYFRSLVSYIAFLQLLNGFPETQGGEAGVYPWNLKDIYPMSPEALIRRLTEEMAAAKEGNRS